MRHCFCTLLILFLFCPPIHKLAAKEKSLNIQEALTTVYWYCSTVDSLPPPQTNSLPKHLPSAIDVEISGLIIDETRTKTGRDFYDLFYNRWIPPTHFKAYTITVKELPARGRVSRIALLLNDKVLTQRVLQPRFDIVEAQVNTAIRLLNAHISKENSLQRQLENEDQQGTGIF